MLAKNKYNKEFQFERNISGVDLYNHCACRARARTSFEQTFACKLP